MEENKEDENGGCYTGIIVVLIIGILIYKNYNKFIDKDLVQKNAKSDKELNDSITNANNDFKKDSLKEAIEFEKLLKNATPLGSTTATPDLTTDEGVREAEELIYESGRNDPEYDTNKYILALPENIRKAKFCKKYTDEAKLYSGMEKSYFDYTGNTIIQKMCISDLAGGYGKKYRTIAEEANQKGYIDTMASRMVIEYKKNGVFDVFENQGFTEFQLYLIPEDGNTIVSEKYSIY